jgi:hypothetical protein
MHTVMLTRHCHEQSDRSTTQRLSRHPVRRVSQHTYRATESANDLCDGDTVAATVGRVRNAVHANTVSRVGGGRQTNYNHRWVPRSKSITFNCALPSGLRERSWYYVCIEWESLNRYNETTGRSRVGWRTLSTVQALYARCIKRSTGSARLRTQSSATQK